MKYSYILVLVSLVILAITGCGQAPDRVEIAETIERSPHRPEPKLNASSEERFQLAMPQGGAQSAMGQQASGPEPAFHWSTPEGWQELPPTQFRTANFVFGPNNQGEAYLTVLPGGGGGPFQNANRWRGQMGLEGYTPDEFNQLPKAEVLGTEAIIVDFEGAYKGMGDPSAKEGYRMVGYLLTKNGQGIFIKMVGPVEAVAQNLDKFEQFASSLHSAEDGHVHGTETQSATAGTSGELPEGHPPVGDLPEDHPPVETAANTESSEESASSDEPREAHGGGYTWTVPAGWERAADRTMRLVTYQMGEDNKTECYITLLGGTAGGEVMNLNRWRGQLGADPLSPDEIENLPEIEVLGEPAHMVEVSGTYVGMSGDAVPGQTLLGVAHIQQDGSVFVRMTGPTAQVEELKDEFIAFCQSLKSEV